MKALRARNAENRAFLFRRIADRPGGARGLLMASVILERAESNLRRLRPEALAEIQATIAAIKAHAENRTSPPDIWQGAHDLRGLAGAFGFDEVGVVAGAIRLYGLDAPDGFEPDWAFLQILARMLVRAFHHPKEILVQILEETCDQAVAAQVAREGRAQDGA